jgi:hypothetical protein
MAPDVRGQYTSWIPSIKLSGVVQDVEALLIKLVIMLFLQTIALAIAVAALHSHARVLDKRNNTGPTIDLGDAGVYVGKLQNNGTVES